jgi:hypothetical protein
MQLESGKQFPLSTTIDSYKFMDDLNLLETVGFFAILVVILWAATKWEIAGKCLLAGMWAWGFLATIATVVILGALLLKAIL